MANETALEIVSEQAVAMRRPGMLEPNTIGELQQIGQLMAGSGLFSDARDVAKACVKILAGREMGLPPFASMTGVAIIQGKPAVGANLLAACMKRAGYTWRIVQHDAKGCRLIIRFKGEELGPSDFTEEDARRADLLGKNTWKQYPKSMYFARAITAAARVYAAEVFAGVPAYTAEELGADDTTEDGALIGEELPADAVDPKRGQQQPSQQQQTHQEPAGQQKQQQRNAQQQQPAAELTPLQAFEHEFRSRDRIGRLKMFQELKGSLKFQLGAEDGEAKYRQILKAHGAEKSDKFGSLGDAIRCILQMKKIDAEIAEQSAAKAAEESAAKATAAPADPPQAEPEPVAAGFQAVDDDVPF